MIRKTLFLLLILFIFQTFAISAEKEYLKIENSSIGRGFANIMSPISDITSQSYNSGALPWSKGVSIDIKDFNNISASQAYPLGMHSVLGLSFNVAKEGIVSGESVENLIALTYSTKLGAIPFLPENDEFYKIGVGATLKYLLSGGISRTGQSDQTGRGYEIDLGIVYRIEPWITFGGSVNNLLPRKALGGGYVGFSGVDGDVSTPAYIKLGSDIKLIGDIRSPIYIDHHSLSLLSEVETRFDRSSVMRIGGEYSLDNSIFFRSGMQFGNGTSFSLGGGYKTEGWAINASYGKSSPEKEYGLLFNFSYFPSDWIFFPEPFEDILPKNGYSTYKKREAIRGKVAPGITLKINSKRINIVKNREFLEAVDLKEGKNEFLLETFYGGESHTKKLVIFRKSLPADPFVKINIYDNMPVNSKFITIEGEVLKDAESLLLQGKEIPLLSSKLFSLSTKLKYGKNRIKAVALFEGEPVYKEFNVINLYKEIKKQVRSTTLVM